MQIISESSNCSLFTAYCSLFTAYCSLFTAYCSLLIVFLRPDPKAHPPGRQGREAKVFFKSILTVHYQLPTVHCSLFPVPQTYFFLIKIVIGTPVNSKFSRILFSKNRL